jgi:hypothetical protein
MQSPDGAMITLIAGFVLILAVAAEFRGSVALPLPPVPGVRLMANRCCCSDASL